MKHISRYLVPNGFDFLHCLKKISLCCLPAKTQLQDISETILLILFFK